eukprot:TRINITY_DN6923_c0_g1_i1.p1 TRINITY_DN6923_c0_g1~~TRINITY_DN6923_c0_g1_i1.p1  ORF type:complete len:145 (+),score=19.25 TRINITY_DN6923_c0_g1_i1:108-542(+)
MAVCSSVRAVMLFISFSEFCLGEVADCQAEYGQSACLPVSSSSLIQGHAASSKPQRAGSDEAPRLADLLQTFQEFVKPSSSSKSSQCLGVQPELDLGEVRYLTELWNLLSLVLPMLHTSRHLFPDRQRPAPWPAGGHWLFPKSR